jgi:iron complex outermembrane receptor protein
MKGPASFVYGFNAFDGVINIITKSSDEMTGTTLQFGGGEFGTITSAAIHAGTVGKLGYRLSLGREQNQQWRNRDALAFRTHKFNLDTRYDLSDQSRLLLSGGLVDADRFDGALSEDVVQADLPAQGYANLAYEHGRFSIRGFWNRYSTADRSEFHPLVAPFQTLTDRFGSQVFFAIADTYNLDIQHGQRLGTSHHVTYGLNYRHNTYSGNFISAYSREDRLGLYAQEEWTATDSLTFVAGVRYDLHSEIHGTLSPRLSGVYRPAEGHSFQVSFSAAYRPPTLVETKQDTRAVSALTTVVSGSPNLDPEQIISYQAGYQGWFLRHRLRARADLFFNQISNLISTRNQSATQAFSTNDPGQADIYGGEAGLEFLATRWLSGFANYSYQEIGQSFTGRVQRGAPRFKWNAGVRGEWENGLSGELIYHYVGAATYPPGQSFTSFGSVGLVTIPTTRVGSYKLLNLRGAYKFWRERAAAGHKREAEFAVSVFNALNDRHKEHPLGDEIGSRVMGWVTLKF